MVVRLLRDYPYLEPVVDRIAKVPAGRIHDNISMYVFYVTGSTLMFVCLLPPITPSHRIAWWDEKTRCNLSEYWYQAHCTDCSTRYLVNCKVSGSTNHLPGTEIDAITVAEDPFQSSMSATRQSVL